MHTPRTLLSLIVLMSLLIPGAASALGGMYVSQKPDTKIAEDATQMVIFRDGDTTSLTIQSTCKELSRDFALIIPVPHNFDTQDVSIVDPEHLHTLSLFTSPRHASHDKQVVCKEGFGMLGKTSVTPPAYATQCFAPKLSSLSLTQSEGLNEYTITETISKTSALSTWLKKKKYKLPRGGKDRLQGYLDAGLKLLIVEVDASKVTVNESGLATLTPLKLTWTSEEFSIPAPTGHAHQDLTLHVISKEGRQTIAHHAMSVIPTNLIVNPSVSDDFTSFYNALFLATLDRDATMFATEYVGDASSRCRTCTLHEPHHELARSLYMLSTQKPINTKVYGTPSWKVASSSKPVQEKTLLRVASTSQRRFQRQCGALLDPTLPAQTRQCTLSRESEAPWKIDCAHASSEAPSNSDKTPALSKLLACEAKVMEMQMKHDGDFQDQETISLLLDYPTRNHLTMSDAYIEGHDDYVITRIRARPDQGALDSPLLHFTAASDLKGGYGMPHPKTETFDSFFEEVPKTSPSRSHFVARYVTFSSPSLEDREACSLRHRDLSWSAPQEIRTLVGSPQSVLSREDLEKAILNTNEAALDL